MPSLDVICSSSSLRLDRRLSFSITVVVFGVDAGIAIVTRRLSTLVADPKSRDSFDGSGLVGGETEDASLLVEPDADRVPFQLLSVFGSIDFRRR